MTLWKRGFFPLSLPDTAHTSCAGSTFFLGQALPQAPMCQQRCCYSFGNKTAENTTLRVLRLFWFSLREAVTRTLMDPQGSLGLWTYYGRRRPQREETHPKSSGLETQKQIQSVVLLSQRKSEYNAQIVVFFTSHISFTVNSLRARSLFLHGCNHRAGNSTWHID